MDTLELMFNIILTFMTGYMITALAFAVKYKAKDPFYRNIIIFNFLELLFLFYVRFNLGNGLLTFMSIIITLSCYFVFFMGYVFVRGNKFFHVTINIFNWTGIFIPWGAATYIMLINLYMSYDSIHVFMTFVNILIIIYFNFKSHEMINNIGKKIDRRFIRVINWLNSGVIVVFTLFYISAIFSLNIDYSIPSQIFEFSQPNGWIIYNLNAFIAIIGHIITTTIMYYIVRKIKNNIERQGAIISKANTSYYYFMYTAMVSGGLNIPVLFFQAFFAEPPFILLRTAVVIYSCVSMINVAYSFVFIINVFTLHPTDKLLTPMMILSGIFIGMFVATSFSFQSIELLSLYLGYFVLVISAVTIYYAFKSAHYQNNPLTAASMKYYGYASTIFLVIILGSAMISQAYIDPNIDLLLTIAARTAQVLHASILYLAYWKPYWFQSRYAISNSRADRIYRNARVVRY